MSQRRPFGQSAPWSSSSSIRLWPPGLFAARRLAWPRLVGPTRATCPEVEVEAALSQAARVCCKLAKRRRRRRHNRRDYFHFIIILCFHSASQAGRRISLPSPFVQLEASKSKRAVESCLSLLSWPQSRLGPKFCSLMLLLFNWNNANVVHCGCCFGNLWGSNRPKQTTDGRKEAKIPAKKPKQATISIFITIMSPKPRSLRLI